MAFIDQIQFFAQAGKGGDGVVRWRKEKFEPRGGPWGGDGGKGGNILIESVRNVTLLSRIAHITRYKAPDGSPGETASRHGKDGEDFIIKLPIGSVITNTETNESFEILKDGEVVTLLSGGRGGYGNEHFKSSTTTSPDFATKGEAGESGNFLVELRLIADAGFVGFPNAGKSSLLAELTNASPKIGDYAFTTLSPNLGAMDGYVLADIPGIIEDASLGRGLGIQFLRHISRTKLLLHCISAERDTVLESYILIRKELEAYGQGIAEKPEVIILTKTDATTEQAVGEAISALSSVGKEVISVSIYDDHSLQTLRSRLSSILYELDT